MSSDKETKPTTGLDVYERTRKSLLELIEELGEAMDKADADAYKRKGYEMIGHYFRTPVHTGELMLTLTTVLEDILHKLEMTQQGEQVTMVRGPYSVMKRKEDE